MSSPKISACIIAYNHEQYIRTCLDGAVNQKMDFEYEIVIGDDNSTDGTSQICEEYANRYPNIIKYFPRTKNLGMIGNWRNTIQDCSGKYIALCEGDDYWIDPLKLQKQVDFLETEADFTMSFHSVEVKNEIEGIEYNYPIPNKDVLFFKDLLFKHYIPTCSVVFRKKELPYPLPEWLNRSKMCDIPLELFIADKGKTKFFDEKMAVYRKNDKSITQNKEHIKQGRKAYEYLYSNLRSHFGNKYFLLFSVVILKNKLGFIKDLLGLNPSIK